MRLTFLGHQSWLLQLGSTSLLIDPLLLPAFGHSPGVDFRVYPPRVLDLDRLGPVDAVFLTHEHLDHFHLPSLDRLDRRTPVLVSELMPQCVVDAVTEIGFSVRVLPVHATVRIGEIELTLYPAGAATIYWEKRVVQILARAADGSHAGVLFAVDAVLADSFVDSVASGVLPAPRAIVCANNSQVTPPGVPNARSNVLPISDGTAGGLQGLRILHSVLVDFPERVPGVSELILSGNGFLGAHGFAHLFSDHRRFAEICNELAVGQQVLGPTPGDVLDLQGRPARQSRADWIRLDEEALAEIGSRQAAQVASRREAEFAPITERLPDDGRTRRALESVLAELPALARAIMVAPMGQLALSTHVHARGSLGPRRIALCIRDGPGARDQNFALDFNRAAFVEIDMPRSELPERYPFGLEIHLSDFAALLDGRLQIWDLAATAIRSWFVGGPYENWMSFLFVHYGEQLRPDLATKVYAAAIRRLREGPRRPASEGLLVRP